MTDVAQTTIPKRDPLNDFARRWSLDGDYIRCRECNRPQIISCCHMDFPHAHYCGSDSSWEQNPWKSLASLITAQIAKAKEPEDA